MSVADDLAYVSSNKRTVGRFGGGDWALRGCIVLYAVKHVRLYSWIGDGRAMTVRVCCIAVVYSEILYRKLYGEVMYRSPRWTVFETL